ncbi:putative membrane protein [Streptomyces sp. Tu6071]|nr:putative membrane protein [Streptomyces sp. Tu6071]
MRTPRPPTSATGTDAALVTLLGAVGAGLTYGTFAYLVGNAVNLALGQRGWSPFAPVEAALHPDVLWPRLPPLALLVGVRIVPAVLTVALAGLAALLWARFASGRRQGMASRKDVAALTGKAIARRAIALRPSLKDRSWKRGTCRGPGRPSRCPGPRRGARELGGRDRRNHGSALRQDDGLGDPRDAGCPRAGGPHLEQGGRRCLHHDVRRAGCGGDRVDARSPADRALPPADVVGHPRFRS